MPIVPFNTNEILNVIVKLDTESIEDIVDNLEQILEKRKNNNQTNKEQKLINKIYLFTSTDYYQRYTELSQNSRLNTIINTEQDELLELIPRIEKDNVERMEHLIMLARLRNTTLRDLMEQLGLSKA